MAEPCPGGCGTDLAELKAQGSLRADASYCSPACSKRYRRLAGGLRRRVAPRPSKARPGTRPATAYRVFRRSGELLLRIGPHTVVANKAEQACRMVAARTGAPVTELVAIPARHMPPIRTINGG